MYAGLPVHLIPTPSDDIMINMLPAACPAITCCATTVSATPDVERTLQSNAIGAVCTLLRRCDKVWEVVVMRYASAHSQYHLVVAFHVPSCQAFQVPSPNGAGNTICE